MGHPYFLGGLDYILIEGGRVNAALDVHGHHSLLHVSARHFDPPTQITGFMPWTQGYVHLPRKDTTSDIAAAVDTTI